MRPYDQTYKKLEAEWKRSCSASHRLWCSCEDYTSHFRWHGYRDTNGSVSDSATGKVVPGPLDGAIITGSGTNQDVEEAINAAVSFKLDDSRLSDSSPSKTLGSAFEKKTYKKMDSSNLKPGNDWLLNLEKKVNSLILEEKERIQRKRRRQRIPYKLKHRKMKRVEVPRDPDDLEGEWTEGELMSYTDSDDY
nr:ORF3 [Torque teno neovison virus]WKF25145.1 ORF3 [Torque teno neovison virus]WKF25152.1 ORF3 [Torque teno neovison virus]